MRLRRTGGGFSPLFLPFRGSRSINGKKIHLHPYTHKGKKEKVSFFLFFVFVRSDGEFVTAPRGEARGRKNLFYVPKNLAALRFSGALFFCEVERVSSSCHFDRGKEQQRLTEWRNLARCVSKDKRLPFHAFTLFKGEGGPHI